MSLYETELNRFKRLLLENKLLDCDAAELQFLFQLSRDRDAVVWGNDHGEGIQDPILREMVDLGLSSACLDLMSHSWRHVPEASDAQDPASEVVDKFSHSPQPDPQKGDWSKYPTLAADMLVRILWNSDTGQLTKIVETDLTQRDYKPGVSINRGLTVFYKVLKYGLSTCKLYTMDCILALLQRVPSIARSNVLLHTNVFRELVLLTEFPDRAFLREVSDNHGAWQWQFLKPGEFIERINMYAPRWVQQIHRVSMLTLLNVMLSQLPAQQLQYCSDGVLISMLARKLCSKIPHDSLPESDELMNACVILHMLTQLPQEAHVTDAGEWSTPLLQLASHNTTTHGSNVGRSVVICMLQRLRHLRGIPDLFIHARDTFKYVPHYLPDILPGKEQIQQVLYEFLDTEVAMWNFLANIAHVESIAAQIVEFHDGWIIECINTVLRRSDPHDKLLHTSQQMRSLVTQKLWLSSCEQVGSSITDRPTVSLPWFSSIALLCKKLIHFGLYVPERTLVEDCDGILCEQAELLSKNAEDPNRPSNPAIDRAVYSAALRLIEEPNVFGERARELRVRLLRNRADACLLMEDDVAHKRDADAADAIQTAPA